MLRKTSANTIPNSCTGQGQIHLEAILAGTPPNNYTVELRSGRRCYFFLPVGGTVYGQIGNYAMCIALRCDHAIDFYKIYINNTADHGAETITWGATSVTFSIEWGTTTWGEMWDAASGITGTPWMKRGDDFNNRCTVTDVDGTTPPQVCTFPYPYEYDYMGFISGEDGVTQGNEKITWGVNSVVFDIEAHNQGLNPVSTTANTLAAAGGVTGTPWAVLTALVNAEMSRQSETAMHDLPDYIAGTDPCSNVATQALSNNFTDSAYHFVKLNIIRNSDTTITTKCTVDQGTELVVNDAADFLDTIFTALSIANVANCFSGQPSVTPVQFFDFRVHKSVLTDAQLKFYYDNVRASGNKTLTQI